MSRKQLYHYFDESPSLAVSWRQLVEQHKNRQPESAKVGGKRHIRHLEDEVQAWKTVAAVARAEADRQAAINQSLRAETERLRAANQARIAQVLRLHADETVT